LEALERKLGIDGSGEPAAGKKRRFDDTEYLEQSKEIVDTVKSAVTAGESSSQPCIPPIQILLGLLKKKKKAKITQGVAAESKDAVTLTSTPSAPTDTGQTKVSPTVAIAS
jgi:hypothetical protein